MPPEVGTQLPPLRIASVDPEVMKTWAPILRDPNPIHLDRDAVRAAGLGDRLINQGPINMSWIMNMLMAAFPGGRLVSISHRFADNIYEGDAVEATGTVTAVEPAAEGYRISCDFALSSAERGVAVSGSAVTLIPREESR